MHRRKLMLNATTQNITVKRITNLVLAFANLSPLVVIAVDASHLSSASVKYISHLLNRCHNGISVLVLRSGRRTS